LAGAERTATVLNWLHRSAAAEVLASLGRGTRPLSHDALDELAPEKTVEHLRKFAAFHLGGVFLALFPIAELARDGNTKPEPGTGGIRFTIGIMVDAADEVDRLTDQMRQAGARVTKEPIDAEFFTGRSAYLADPEGNYFEIVWADEPDNPIVASARGAGRR